MATTLSLRAPHSQLLTFATAALLGIGFSAAQAQTTLGVGDVSFLAAESDSNGAIADGMTIVPWVSLASGTVIKFTDNGVDNAAGTLMNNTEHVWTFTVGASAISAGTALKFSYDSPTAGRWNGPASGTVSANLAGTGATVNPGVSTSGDQFFIYQGSGTGANIGTGDPGSFTGSLVAGINFGGIIATGNADSNGTYVPTALVNGNAWVNGGNVDNAYYAGTRTGLTNALYRAATNSVTNFTLTNTLDAAYSHSTNFTIGSAASIHWDANGNTAGNGGAGTWDATTADRFKNGAAGTTYFRWVNSSSGNDHNAVFGGTAGTVSVASAGVTASGLQFDVTGYTVQNNTVTLSGTTTPTLNVVTAGHTATVASTLSGASGLSKTGAGTARLTGDNTFTGATTISSGTLEAASTDALGGTSSVTVNSGGTLLLSGAGTDRIGNTATVNLAGGTIAFSGNVIEGSSAGTGALTLSSSSVIDFANGNASINFGASSLATWASGAALSIWNWDGSTAGGGNDRLLFGGDSTSLTSVQLDQIQFFTGAGTGFIGTGMFVGSLGEVVPVPEPASIISAALLLGLASWRERYRRRAQDRVERRAAVCA